MTPQSSPKKRKPITYAQVGDNYETKDPIKRLVQVAARQTGKHLKKYGFGEVSGTRGESAFVWSLNPAWDILLASVTEGLGTKNLIADAMRKITGKTYYEVIGHDTVATIINDLISVGAKPLVIHAYWAIENNEWLQDKKRMVDLIDGWKSACDSSGATWGGGETATLKQIITPNTVDLGGSAIGIIRPKARLINDQKLKPQDRILLLRSTGVNANGISLTRAIAKRISKGYATKLPSGRMYGEELLTKTNIYANLIQDLLDSRIEIHYISNITGHGLRKIMRARQNYTYLIERTFEPQEIFNFIQYHANLSDYEMYQTYNMGMDYALYLPKKDMIKAQKIIRKNRFESIDAGYVELGPRRVIFKTKNIVFEGESLKIR